MQPDKHTFFIPLPQSSFADREKQIQIQTLRESEILERQGFRVLGSRVNVRSDVKASVTIFYRKQLTFPTS